MDVKWFILKGLFFSVSKIINNMSKMSKRSPIPISNHCKRVSTIIINKTLSINKNLKYYRNIEDF